MWSLPEWTGRWFPAATTETLTAYATWCNAVEGNTTFYAEPSPSTVAKWYEQAPADFRFCFKLPRTITHDRRLRHVDDELERFLTAMAPLADRCGPMQIQLPAGFGPDDLDALVAFIDLVPRTDWTWAVEVRHHEFFPGGEAERKLNDALAARAVNRVLLDSRALFAGPCRTPAEIEAFGRKPRVPVRPVATARSQPCTRYPPRAMARTASPAIRAWDMTTSSPATSPSMARPMSAAACRTIGPGSAPVSSSQVSGSRRSVVAVGSFRAAAKNCSQARTWRRSSTTV